MHSDPSILKTSAVYYCPEHSQGHPAFPFRRRIWRHIVLALRFLSNTSSFHHGQGPSSRRDAVKALADEQVGDLILDTWYDADPRLRLV